MERTKNSTLLILLVIGVFCLIGLGIAGFVSHASEIEKHGIEQRHRDATDQSGVDFSKQWSDFFFKRELKQRSKNSQFDAEISSAYGLQRSYLESDQLYFNGAWNIESNQYESYARSGLSVADALRKHPEEDCLPPPR